MSVSHSIILEVHIVLNCPYRTHIITCSLTPAKAHEFKHMKVVRPEWLVDSAAAGALLPWNNFVFRPGGRPEQSQGTQIGQETLKPISRPKPGPETSQLKISQAPSIRSEQRKPVGSTSKPPSISDTASPSRPLYITDPGTREDAARVPGYAMGRSNELAERVMADSQWRAAHTSIAPDFIEEYYKNSRLHHLSMWKSELKNLVAEAQERAESGKFDKAHDEPGVAIRKRPDNEIVATTDVSMRGIELVMRSPSKSKGKQKAEEHEKVVMHCDFDCFFVSAGLTTRPHLRGKPVVVCHSQGNQGGASSTSEIASSSYEARSFGIKNGMRYEPSTSPTGL